MGNVIYILLRHFEWGPICYIFGITWFYPPCKRDSWHMNTSKKTMTFYYTRIGTYLSIHLIWEWWLLWYFTFATHFTNNLSLAIKFDGQWCSCKSNSTNSMITDLCWRHEGTSFERVESKILKHHIVRILIRKINLFNEFTWGANIVRNMCLWSQVTAVHRAK